MSTSNKWKEILRTAMNSPSKTIYARAVVAPQEPCGFRFELAFDPETTGIVVELLGHLEPTWRSAACVYAEQRFLDEAHTLGRAITGWLLAEAFGAGFLAGLKAARQ